MNANGITSKKVELTQYLHTHNIDIACITETHLNNSNKFYIPEYRIYRNDRIENKGGGVLIAVKNNINHHEINIPNTTGIETVAISLKLNNQSWNIIAAYKPPTIKIQPQNILNLFTPNKNTLILGDFNAKHINWGCHTSNQAGKTLSQILTNTNINILSPTEPTYYPRDVNKKPDILDIGLTDGNINFYSTPIS